MAIFILAHNEQHPTMYDTLPHLQNSSFPAITRNNLEILQVNLGYLCNLSCTHCHVNAGPNRTELMTQKTIEQILHFIDVHPIHTLDLTGGAPEMNPLFSYIVEEAVKKNIKVIDRCNLTILLEPNYLHLPTFLAKNNIEIVASLPCYMEDNVDKQRGKGTFNASICALQKLNDLGYGQIDSGLILNLVFNPQDATLPPDQNTLEHAYKQHLSDQFNIVFNHLFAMTNLPIQRFGSVLISKGEFKPYLQLLENNFQPQNLERLMCKNTLSVDWQGFVYDCDFNQMLQLPLGGATQKIHLSTLTTQISAGQTIKTLQHCYGCTAGQGSSCGGTL